MKVWTFELTVELEDTDDADALMDALTGVICRHYGQDECSEELECPRFWFATHWEPPEAVE